jgi:hypothetical protein
MWGKKHKFDDDTDGRPEGERGGERTTARPPD